MWLGTVLLQPGFHVCHRCCRKQPPGCCCLPCQRRSRESACRQVGAGGREGEVSVQQQGWPALLVVRRLDLSRERGLRWNAWICQERFLYLLLWRGVGWVFLLFVSSPFYYYYFFLPLHLCFDLCLL